MHELTPQPALVRRVIFVSDYHAVPTEEVSLCWTGKVQFITSADTSWMDVSKGVSVKG